MKIPYYDFVSGVKRYDKFHSVKSKNYNCLAIDLATNKTGYCIFHAEDKNNFELAEIGVLKAKATDDLMTRIYNMTYALIGLIKEIIDDIHVPKLAIGIEEPFLVLKGVGKTSDHRLIDGNKKEIVNHSSVVLIGANFVLRNEILKLARCYPDKSINIFGINNLSWKLSTIGYAAIDKDMIAADLCQYSHKVASFYQETGNYDGVDAYGIGRYMINDLFRGKLLDG